MLGNCAAGAVESGWSLPPTRSGAGMTMRGKKAWRVTPSGHYSSGYPRVSPYQQNLSPPRKPLLHSLPSPLAEGRLPEAFVGRSGERRLGFRLASGGLEARNPPAGESRPPTPRRGQGCVGERARRPPFLLCRERGTRRGLGSYGPGRQPHGAPPAHESGCGAVKPKTAAAGASTSALIRTTRRRSSSARQPSCLARARMRGTVAEPGSNGAREGERMS